MRRIAIAIFGVALLLGLSACVGVVDQPYSAGYPYEDDGYGDGYFYPGGYYFRGGYFLTGYYYRHHHHPHAVRIHHRIGHVGHRDHVGDRHHDFKRQPIHRDHPADRHHFSKKHRDRTVTKVKFGNRLRFVETDRIDHSRKQFRKGNDLGRSDLRLKGHVRGVQAGAPHKTDMSRRGISRSSGPNPLKGGQKHFTGGWKDRRRGPSMHRGQVDHGRRLIGSDSRGRGGFEKRGRADRKGFCSGRSC